MSMLSSQTKTRPSGAQATAVGWRIREAVATRSTVQPAAQVGRSSPEAPPAMAAQERRGSCCWILVGCLLGVAGPTAAAEPSASAKRPAQILAHTMPWFEAKPAHKQWGWHWTMKAFDPDRVHGERREIAAHY